MAFLRTLFFLTAASLASQEAVPDLVFRQALDYGGRPLVLALDLYLPPGPGPFPVMVIAHPGAYIAGDKADMAPLGRAWARRGVAALSINYHLGYQPDARNETEALTEVYADVKAAFAWVAAHQDEYRFDTDRVYLTGGSSGGHLAMAAGVLYPLEKDRPVNLRGVIAMYGGLFESSLGPEATPLLILQGTLDQNCLPDASRRMARLYREAGAWCELVVIEGMYHDWNWYYRHLLLDRAARFVRWRDEGALPSVPVEEWIPDTEYPHFPGINRDRDYP